MGGSGQTGGTKHPDALILIDVINDFEFPGARKLLRSAETVADRISALKARASRAGVPIVYVNDNFGRWRSDFRQQVEHCMARGCPGRKIVEKLQPDENDFFVLKPMHSGFYSTTLALLLDELGSRRLILCGFAADLCVLYTANDAYMRHFDLAVPADCTAAETRERDRFALQHIENQLKADIRDAAKIRFRRK